jgi:quercetin dioxygenase-like cupin family protein
MPIIQHSEAPSEEGFPGVNRAVLVDANQGSLSLHVGHLTLSPGSSVTTHIHPDTEEAMVIVEGSLEALLGDETVTVGTGDTVLAPAGVKHGFVNRTQEPAKLLAVFPQTSFQRVLVD